MARRAKKDEAKVDETSKESMGASDAPAWTTGEEPPPGAAAKPDSRGLWPASASVPAFEPLKEDARTEVLVVGAGLTGVTAAYLLAKRGR
jgi:hypothetical protein